MPLGEPEEPQRPPSDGQVTVSVTELQMTGRSPVKTFVLQNNTPETQIVQITKRNHRLYYDDGTRDEVEDEGLGETCAPNCPLFWLTLGLEGEAEARQTLEVSIPPDGAGVKIEVGGADTSDGVRWQGGLTITTANAQPSVILMHYSESLQGQWKGTIRYFADFGDTGLEEWLSLGNPEPGEGWGDTRDDGDLHRVENAFVERWRAFRTQGVSWDEFQAIMTATQEESWRLPNVQRGCPGEACYPYVNNSLGLRVYSNDLRESPVPSGVIDLPIGFNFYVPNEEESGVLSGRVNSAQTLHYAGDPAAALRLQVSPEECSRSTIRTCINFIESFEVTVDIGGRYETGPGPSECEDPNDGSYQRLTIPWLVPGFSRNTSETEQGGLVRHECRSAKLPFSSEDPDAQEALEALNLNLSGSNALPDGRIRRRTLSLIDGALIDQSTIFIIFRETFEGLLGGEGGRTYGYMVLQREPEELDETDANNNTIPDVYEGSVAGTRPEEPSELSEAVQCSPELEDLIGGNNANLIEVLLRGVPSSGNVPEIIRGLDEEKVHYLCVDNGLFNSGGDSQALEPCPLGSEVIYFTSTHLRSELGDLACQDTGDCAGVLADWLRSDDVLIQYQPTWRCEDENSVYCDDDRFNLKEGKVFYKAPNEGEQIVLNSLDAEIEQAFRYKIRFQGNNGAQVGFAPTICVPDSEQIPYCYDPEAIEAIRARVDCILATRPGNSDADEMRRSYLTRNFSYEVQTSNQFGPLPFPIARDGFERLYAELLIMQGDESVTRAFMSRYDLAQQNLVSFQGSLMEPDGIDLSGVAGFEMYSLYQGVQYYQEALDRFYALAPFLSDSLDDEEADFITAETATSYLERLVRASTQKARALSQIAKRYQTFNRPDLARRVIERGYTATYIESSVLAQIMLRITDAEAPQNRPQIGVTLQNAARRYRMALLDMRTVYNAITDQTTFFGIPPDTIPFPTVDERESNAFEQMLNRIQTKIQLAREREENAINSNRSFQTDTEQFQQELVSLRNTYESQLLNLCGSFEAGGRIYPAISTHAVLNERAAFFGDPCGIMGNGQIHDTLARLDIQRIEAQRTMQQGQNILDSVEIERARVSAQCDLIDARADFVYNKNEAIKNLEDDIREYQTSLRVLETGLQNASVALGALQCSDLQVSVCTVAFTAWSVAAVGITATVAGLEGDIVFKEREIDQLQLNEARWLIDQECEVAEVDSNARTAELLLGLKEVELQLLQHQYEMALTLSQVDQLRNRARRLQLEQSEAAQLAINVQAARNDPNVRVYRNDAVVNAEFAFEDALRELFRATRVLEYYTSQSFAGREQLFLIRLVARGDYNLENYLVDLQNAFFEFEDTFGLPEKRVERLSLRDDILAIPRLDEAGAALSSSERTTQFRASLRDPSRLDERGYLSFPFGTRTDQLSPLTRNHKIVSISAELVGANLGDPVGRLYLQANGTSAVSTLNDETAFYRFPKLTAVINPYFNGNKFFEPEIYRTLRLRDRPFANTQWRLILNQRDERANQDIDLSSLDDIFIYITYSDFTTLD